MSRPSAAERLGDYERRYRELAGQLATELATIGLIHSGSVVRRYTYCGTTNCRCHGDPPQPHGPYWQWSAKVKGKTVTRHLSPAEAELYQEWIANDRRLTHRVQQMRQVATKAAQLTLEQVASK